jgi:aspartate kinase
MRVLKFGGTSVADAGAIARVVSIVGGCKGARTVVVSALAGVTDGLLAVADLAAEDGPAALAALHALAARHRTVAAHVRASPTRQVLDAAVDGIARGAVQAVNAIVAAGQASPALVDRLVANGELWSSRIVAAFLADAGIPTQWIDARHVIRTNGRHREAIPDLMATEQALTRLVRPALALDRVTVMGGFIGSAPDGATTTLGRGGSDYSAALVGACLDASEIEIWTDVDGVLSADPRVVADARVLPMLSYDDAETLARFGAKVLHPKTMEPAAARGIPVHVRNSNRPGEPGTRIDALGSGDGAHAAVASRDGVSLVEMTALGKGAEGSFAARALLALSDANVTVVLGEVHGDRVLVAVDQALDLDALRARVAAFAEVRMRDGLAAVCAVGDRLATERGLVTGAFGVLAGGPVHLVSRPGGSASFAVVVDVCHAHALVARLHDWFSAGTVDAREEAVR